MNKRKLFSTLAYILLCQTFFSSIAMAGLNQRKKSRRRKNKGQLISFDRFFQKDLDSNNIIDEAEIKMISRKRVRERVLKFDLNRDGRVTLQELIDSGLINRKVTVDKVNKEIKNILTRELSKDNYKIMEIKEFSWLKNNHKLLVKFDRNKNQKLDPQEIESVVPVLTAFAFSKKIYVAAGIIGKSPSDQKEKQLRRFAYIMDYDANDIVTEKEFKSFLNKIFGEKPAKIFIIVKKKSLQKKSNQVQNSISNRKNEDGVGITNPRDNLKKQPKHKAGKLIETSIGNDSEDDVDSIIPQIRRISEKVAPDQDPLMKLLKVNGNKEVLW